MTSYPPFLYLYWLVSGDPLLPLPYFCPSNWQMCGFCISESYKRKMPYLMTVFSSQMFLRRTEQEKQRDFSFVFLQSKNKATILSETVVALVLGQHLKVYRFSVLQKRTLSFKLVNVVNYKFHMTLSSAQFHSANSSTMRKCISCTIKFQILLFLH